jgi:membrane protein implicated in regulation of membrane protease activity
MLNGINLFSINAQFVIALALTVIAFVLVYKYVGVEKTSSKKAKSRA